MLILNQIDKSFSHSFEPILRSVNLELAQGEFTVLIGSNGSGKSTLLKIITGEYQSDAGYIKIADQDVTHQPLFYRAHYISSVTQDISQGTVQEMTLLENLVLSMLRGQKPKLNLFKNHRERAIQALQALGLGLEKYLDTPLSALSGGQRQMIATLMALLSHPNILLLDEHTSALDPKTQKRLMAYTAEQVKAQNITTLMITHNLEEAVQYGNRLIMLHRGQIVFDVKGEEKLALKVGRLLDLFHQYEDKLLVNSGVGTC